MTAEHTRSAEAAEALLAAGADVRAVNKVHIPLCATCLMGITHHRYCIYSIACIQFGWSPLHEAAQNDNALAVGIFLQHGADVELADMVSTYACRRVAYYKTLLL